MLRMARWAQGRRRSDQRPAGGERLRRRNAHPTASDRTAETAYVIDGDDLLELNRTLDGPEPPRVIYHSHPNGKAYFSETDRRVAVDPWEGSPVYPVQQLVVGIDAHDVVEARLFDWDAKLSDFVEVAAFKGSGSLDGE